VRRARLPGGQPEDLRPRFLIGGHGMPGAVCPSTQMGEEVALGTPGDGAPAVVGASHLVRRRRMIT
jgi:hypothetical protein